MPLPGVSLADRTPVLEDFTAPTSDVLGAVAEDAWNFSASPALARMSQLAQAQGGESPMLSQDEAMQQIGGLPLTIPEEGIRSGALNLLVNRKQAELKRQSVLARAEGGVAQGVAGFTTGLAVSMLDPLNIATAFIPVVGQARYASMRAKAGGSVGSRAMVRERRIELRLRTWQARVRAIIRFPLFL